MGADYYINVALIDSTHVDTHVGEVQPPSLSPGETLGALDSLKLISETVSVGLASLAWLAD